MRCHEISAPSLFYGIKFYWQWPKNTKISPSPASQPSHGQVHEWMISNSGKKDNFPRIFWVKKVTDFNLRRHFKTKPLHCFQKEKCGFFGPNFFSPFPFTIYINPTHWEQTKMLLFLSVLNNTFNSNSCFKVHLF